MANYKLKLKSLIHDSIDKLCVIEDKGIKLQNQSKGCSKFQEHKWHEKVAEDLFLYLLYECPHEEEVKIADRLSSALSRIVVAPQNIQNVEQFNNESAVKLEEANFIDMFLSKVEDVQKPENHDEVVKFFKNLGNLGFSNQDELARFLFLFLWRFIPEIFPWVEKHPADSRAPNHSIYDHLVQTSAVVSALPKPAFLLFTISPVQEFISKARKTSDLWAGSYILSYLIYKAIEIIIEKLGPDNVIFPNLLGQPLVDGWLANLKLSNETFKEFFSRSFGKEKWFQKFVDNAYSDEKLTIANFPNRFLAIVPYAKDGNQNFGIDLAREIEKAVKDTLSELANKVVEKLKTLLSNNNLSIPQIENHLLSYFQIYWVLMPWTNDIVYSPDDALNDYKELISGKTETYKVVEVIKNHPYYKPANVGSAYSILLELTEKLLGARKSIRNHIQNDYYESGGEKCNLCGEFEVLWLLQGKPDWNNKSLGEKNEKIWNSLQEIVKKNEKLCGVCLTKRLFPEIIKDILGLKDKIKFPSTPEMASIGEKRRLTDEVKNQFKDKFDDFNQKIKQNPQNNRNLPETISVPKLKGDPLDQIDGQWLMEENYRKDYFKKEYGLDVDEKDFDNILKLIKDNKISPSKYYAILMMDGDNMEKWLKGEFNPEIKDTIHSKTRDALLRYSNDKDLENLTKLLCLKHPISPSIHQAFSRRLSKFATEVVRKIVEDSHYGKLVYTGGDDVLALLPIEDVLDCGYEIQNSFKKILSPKASMSAGVLIAYYKYPLYLALEEVREVEKIAKEKYQKDAFCIRVLKHSGEQREFGGKWSEIQFIREILCKFKMDTLPSRLAYDFAEVVNEVGALNMHILSTELKRIYLRKSDDREFLEKLLEKFKGITEAYSVYDFINLLLISRFIADEIKV